jgi:hypothetical protein
MPRRKAPAGKPCDHHKQRVAVMKGVRVQLCTFCDAVVAVIGNDDNEEEELRANRATST